MLPAGGKGQLLVVRGEFAIACEVVEEHGADAEEPEVVSGQGQSGRSTTRQPADVLPRFHVGAGQVVLEPDVVRHRLGHDPDPAYLAALSGEAWLAGENKDVRMRALCRAACRRAGCRG